MQTEYEVKFYPVDKEAIRTKIESHGGTLEHAETKTLISAYNKSLNPQIDGDYLRVRNEGNKVRMSIKIHAIEGGKIDDQKELDVIVSDFDTTLEILKRSGLHQTGFQEKYRETWLLNGAEVVIDTWPGLETYIEIEGRSEEDVRAIAELLGFNWNDKIITSVVEIYMNKYQLTAEKAHQLLKHTTFSENPFEKLSA